ncbi:MAG: proline--tRNA ligase [Patescibacteria group bacterium]
MKTQFEKKELKKKSENLSDWYTDVILKAELADYGPVRGTMVIRPYGYAIWELVHDIIDPWFKKGGVKNAYFPMFIPHSLLKKEASHVEGFSPELALVTIGGGEQLKEPLVVRPTSEAIMYDMYSKWIQSWRDLPVKINQWNNVVRWEKRTYLFLRTLEFLWQEGHTAHTSYEEAQQMTMDALEWYRKIYEEYYAIPVVVGVKSDSERFAGADSTYTVEALMPDGKALQGATSHNLGQNFAKAFDINYQDKEGKSALVWQTSWGLSTRSLGGLFLTHGDDNGLILPPKISPVQVVIVPIFLEDHILDYCQEVEKALTDAGVRVELDIRDGMTAGRKFNDWEVKGVPVRLEIGGKEMEEKVVTSARRDTGEKAKVNLSTLKDDMAKTLEEIQSNLYQKAKKYQQDNTYEVNSYDEFKKIMETSRGFIKAYWCENADCETKIKEETKASTRAKELDQKESQSKCIYCNKEAKYIWYFAQAY